MLTSIFNFQKCQTPGHKDIQVTLNTYTDVFNEFKEKEIEKIDDFFNK